MIFFLELDVGAVGNSSVRGDLKSVLGEIRGKRCHTCDGGKNDIVA